MTLAGPAVRDATEADLLGVSVRPDFPILDCAEIYLDNAATAHKPQAVLDAVVGYYSSANANVGRGYHRLGHLSTETYESARAEVARSLGAASPTEVVFTGSTTDATNLLAELLVERSLRPGDDVLVTGMEHNSNLLPWHRACERSGAALRRVPVSDTGRVDLDAYAAMLGPRTRVVAVAHVSNVLGTVNPIAEMATGAHRVGAVIVVDGAQAVPHRAVDVRALGADFYCFSAHKVYGPMGLGVLWGRAEMLSSLPPHRIGGGTVKAVDLDRPITWVPTPARLEAGTPHVAGAVGLAAALRYVDGLGRDRVAAHDAALVRRVIDRVAAIPRVRVVGQPGHDPCGIVSLDVEGIHPYDVGAALDRAGIAVRCGVHCASVFLDRLGLVGTVRLSFGVYNTSAEVDRVAEVLASVGPGDWTRHRPTTRFL